MPVGGGCAERGSEQQHRSQPAMAGDVPHHHGDMSTHIAPSHDEVVQAVQWTCLSRLSQPGVQGPLPEKTVASQVVHLSASVSALWVLEQLALEPLGPPWSAQLPTPPSSQLPFFSVLKEWCVWSFRSNAQKLDHKRPSRG